MINVLILSGKNNHDWQKTTPALVKMYQESKLFTVSVSDSPDTLTYRELIKYDVVVSNWNFWPENDIRLNMEWENDFLRYVNEGGGVVTIHAGGSSFYNWDEYHRIGIGRWGEETKHGKQTEGKVFGFDQTHPVTKGLSEFYVFDEIWENTDIYPGADVLAYISGVNETDKHQIKESAIFVNESGKGRTFYIILGHDEHALNNKSLQTVLLRAAQWTAKHNVTIKP